MQIIELNPIMDFCGESFNLALAELEKKDKHYDWKEWAVEVSRYQFAYAMSILPTSMWEHITLNMDYGDGEFSVGTKGIRIHSPGV